MTTKEQTLSAAGAKWFQSRAIDPDTVIRYGVYTTKRKGIGEVIAYPFRKNGAVVNNKYRGKGKTFSQDNGGVQIFFNYDAISDPALAAGTQALIITEGENDFFSCVEVGYPLTVSVPSGGPGVSDDDAGRPKRDDEIDPGDDKKFGFIWDAWEHLSKVKRIIICVDDDRVGRVLAQELVRRLGAARCLFVTYPPDLIVPDERSEGGFRRCKDANEVLMYVGATALQRMIAEARPYPVKGLYKMSDYPETELVTHSSGWPELDAKLRIYAPEFMVVTGTPGSGKSTWTWALSMNLAISRGWRVAVGTFENDKKPTVRRDLRCAHGGSITDADAFIEDHYVFIDQAPSSEDEDADLEWMLDRAADAVVRYGIRMLILDPFNEIEHKRRPGETMEEYIARAIRAMKRFGRNYGVVVVVVAHPAKMNKGKEGAVLRPGLYDINGAAHWYNKADHGIVVHRPKKGSPICEVHIEKVRLQPDSGMPGMQRFMFNLVSRRFEVIPDEEIEDA